MIKKQRKVNEENQIILKHKNQNARFIIRGLRNTLDFEYEKNISFSNEYLESDIQTIFLLTNPKYSHISSTIVREIVKSGGNADQFVPAQVKLNESNN